MSKDVEEWLTLVWMESMWSYVGRDDHILVLQGVTVTL